MSEIEPRSRRVPDGRDARDRGSSFDYFDDGLHRGSDGDVRRRVSYLDDGEAEAADLADARAWLAQHKVSLAAAAMIIVQLVWKARFLSGFYFRQDDIHFTELALRSPLDWKYLSYVGSGHLHPGVLLIVWIMARAALYSWGLASAVALIMVALASLAAWWLLRTLIGNRPAILIPLALYLVTPLTFPNDSWWQSGIESLPVQAVIFASLASHVSYVRTGRARHLAAAAAFLAIGMVFFEKAAVVPVLLFCVTAGFLVERRRLAVSIRMSLLKYWRAWALYVAMVAVYAVVLFQALHHSTVKAGPPTLASSLTFSGDLIKDSLLPGLLGGPWHWVLLGEGAVAYAAPGTALIWLTAVTVLAIIVMSALTRPRAWRAWAILGIWIVLADIAPVLLGRLAGHKTFTVILAMDTRYVADTPAVAAICVALAFWPVVRAGGEQSEQAAHGGQRDYFAGQGWRVAGLGLTAVIVIGSAVSVQSYLSRTSAMNFAGRLFWSSAKSALAHPRPGSVVYDQRVPQKVMLGLYGNDSLESAVLNPLVSSSAAHDFRWTTSTTGTNLLMIANDGSLRPASVLGGVQSQRPPGAGRCWPGRHGKVVIRLSGSEPPTFSGELRLGYLAGAAAAAEDVTVSYAGEQRQLTVQAGLNSAYFPVQGSASTITLTSPGAGVCVGDAEVGYLVAP